MIPILAAGGDVPPFMILLGLVLGGVVIVSLVLARFRQSLLIGYFLCGLALRNSGVLQKMGADSAELIYKLSDVGVVLLLFTLGIEFSIKELKALRKPAFLGGGLQMLISTVAIAIAARCLGLDWGQAGALGACLALSSTAVSLKTFQDLGQPDTPQGRTTLGIALFQDLAAIFFMILIPVMVGSGEGGGTAILFALLKAVAFIAALIFVSRNGMPQMLDAVARTRSRELFTVTVVALCVCVALVAGLLGLSPALGAFAAGILVSESIYSHRVLSDILPFKDLFLTVFFVSVGLLIDLQMLASYWWQVALGAIGLLLLKGLIAALAGRLSGLRSGEWIVVGAAMSSSGEFSIVLLNRIGDFNIFSPTVEKSMMISTALGMSLVPSLMRLTTKRLAKTRAKRRQSPITNVSMGLAGEVEAVADHVIICGYGPVGQNLHRNLKKCGIPVIILELNPETVKSLLKQGVMCLFADATHPEALTLAHIERARAIVFSFPLTEIILESSRVARELNPGIVIHARCRFAADAKKLDRADIQHIFLDERESGQAIIRAVTNSYAISEDGRWE